MRTRHPLCHLCLNDNHKSSHCYDLYLYVHSWSRHLNLLKTPVKALTLKLVSHGKALDIRSCVSWAPVLQTGRPVHPFLVLSSPVQVVFSLSSFLQLHFTQTRSFTLCQGKARLEDWGQPSRTVPHRPRWGECRPFMRWPGRFAVVCSLPLKNVLPPAETRFLWFGHLSFP